MNARKLKRPNVGECQQIYNKYSINDSNHTGTTSDLCAVITELENRIKNGNHFTDEQLKTIGTAIEDFLIDDTVIIDENGNVRDEMTIHLRNDAKGIRYYLGIEDDLPEKIG